METINIHSSLYDYSVNFTEDFSKQLADFESTTAYVIDVNVYKLYEKQFVSLDKNHIFFMDAVEHKKNMDTCMKIMTFFQKIGVRKNWKVVCFGGGITQDVTTIASDLYIRNVDWYFFPTTLLSMCDSCIGGKCGINFNGYKNQIGVFYPPKKIFIDTHFINTLTNGDYLNGWGELLKFSLTNDKTFYEEIKNEKQYIPCINIAKYIHKGLFIKKQVIEEDEFESDLRRILNYGHTFGHALEAYTDNAIPHGQGVIFGIDIVNYIAWKEGLISKEYYFDIKHLIKKAFLKEEIVVKEPEKLFNIIKTDKKVKGNIINLAVLDGPSHLKVYPMSIDQKLEDYFLGYLKETHEYYYN
jgi:3-dehydroquinate synthase